MISFVIRRLAATVLVLLALTAILFALNRLAPSNQARLLLGPRASPEAIEKVERELWLDRPLPLQYVRYTLGLLRGDLQYSLRTRRPVREDLADHLPATIVLAVSGFILAVAMALVLALSSGLRWRTAAWLRILLVAGASAPTYMVAIGGIVVLFARLGWLPAGGETGYYDPPTGPTGFLLMDALLAERPSVFLDAIRHLILPALSIAIAPAVVIGRVLRSSLLATRESQYVRTARAKGLRNPRIIGRHALRNALGPALSVTAVQLGFMLAGVVVVEEIFSWPGLGRYAADSIAAGDFPGVAGVTLVAGAAYVTVNTVADIAQALTDPRVRLE